MLGSRSRKAIWLVQSRTLKIILSLVQRLRDHQLAAHRNCWRIEAADRLLVIIDGKASFRALHEALLKAERMVMMIGWDFDFEIEMLPGDSDADGIASDSFPDKVEM